MNYECVDVQSAETHIIFGVGGDGLRIVLLRYEPESELYAGAGQEDSDLCRYLIV